MNETVPTFPLGDNSPPPNMQSSQGSESGTQELQRFERKLSVLLLHLSGKLFRNLRPVPEVTAEAIDELWSEARHLERNNSFSPLPPEPNPESITSMTDYRNILAELRSWVLSALQHRNDTGELISSTSKTGNTTNIHALAARFAVPTEPAFADPASPPNGTKQGEGEKPAADPYAELHQLARDLSKLERAVIEALCGAFGELPLADVKTLCDWQDPIDSAWNSLRMRLNKKLESSGWKVRTRRRAACLMKLAPE